MIPDPFKHQAYTIAFQRTNNIMFDTSDPGVGKTRSALDAIKERLSTGHLGKTLVLAPKSILQPAWGNDIELFCPSLRYVIAIAPNRERAFKLNADVYITNHDAVRWLTKNKKLLKGFNAIIIDESTAFKNPQSQRSRALKALIKQFKYRVCMTGTPNSNTILNIWHQALLLDDGKRLGPNFYQFRASVCAPKQVGPGTNMIKWVDKDGAEEAVAALLADITVRHKFEECIDIPEHTTREMHVNLNPKHRKLYETLKKDCIIELQNQEISAIHAGALATKLLQLCSGAVYTGDTEPALIDNDRYELVTALIEQREQCVVAFHWRHQRDQLVALAQSKGFKYAVIDGSIKLDDRISTVKAFQKGEIKVIYAQLRSAAHGLTLTRGTTTIWPSPTYDAEKFVQFNKRIYRAGQTRKTETILISARNTIEEQVYEKMQGKRTRMITLLDLLQIPTTEATK